MSAQSRRQFLRLAAGASFLPSFPFLQPAPSSLWAVDAGNVRVFPGPWTALPPPAPGVRLESLRLRMPDGIHLHALLYLPDDLKSRGWIPGVLNTTPYRNVPRSDSYFARHGYAAIATSGLTTSPPASIPRSSPWETTKSGAGWKEDDPATASLEISGNRVETQGERRLEARAEGSLRSTVDSFLMDIECTLLENGKIVRSGRWKDEARRELV